MQSSTFSRRFGQFKEAIVLRTTVVSMESLSLTIETIASRLVNCLPYLVVCSSYTLKNTERVIEVCPISAKSEERYVFLITKYWTSSGLEFKSAFTFSSIIVPNSWECKCSLVSALTINTEF